MSHDEPAPDSLEELRRLGEHVRDLSSELSGEDHDVTEIVATTSGTTEPVATPAAEPSTDEPGPDPQTEGTEPEVDEPGPLEREAAEEAADAEAYANANAASETTSVVDQDGLPGIFDVEDLTDDRPPRRHDVTAVLVAHDGHRWLPAVLTALGRATRLPDRLVAVDTGSTDDTPSLLARGIEAGLVSTLVTAGRDTGYGAAVQRGVEASTTAPRRPVPAPEGSDPDEAAVRWIWLLHDDSAPDAHALEALLRAADRHRSVDILGPKVRGWGNRAALLEVGVSVARSGNRWTGLERRELDQGQHDGDRDVLAVSSAGMLVRREVWDALGGMDPALPFFRDDVDLCWRARRAGHRVMVATDAVVHHREAAAHGRRDVHSGNPPHPERPHRIDRASAVHLMRAHASGVLGPLVTLRQLLGSLLRALGLLLGKDADAARDEWGAFRDSVRDRSGLRASRARVAEAAASPGAVPEKDVRTLLAARGAQLRHAADSVAVLVAGREQADATRSVLDSTNDDPEGWYDDDARPSRLRRALSRPGTLVVLGLLVTTLVGVRGLLGDGVLLGGALQPAPEGAGDLWSAYTTAWHEIGVGSASDSPAWLLPIFLLAGLMRGSASLAVDVVLLLSIPLAGLTSWLALRGLPVSLPARIWVVAAYATLPAFTGALSGGRLGSAAALVLLPWLVRSSARLVGVGRPVTWRRAFGTGLLLSVVAAFTPVVWVMAVPLAVVAAFTVARGTAARIRLAVTALLPALLLVPWSLRLVREPALLLLEPGISGPVDPNLTAVDVILLRPGGPGSSPLWLGLGIVVAGLGCLGVPGRRRAVAAAWLVGLVGLVTAVVMTVLRVSLPSVQGQITPWAGVPTALWGGALIVAIALTVDLIPQHLSGRDFGWRQPTVVVLVVLLALAPIGAVALLVMGVDGPLHRGDRAVLPAFVAAEMRGDERPRALVLRRGEGAALVYDLMSVPEPQTGDRDVAPPLATSVVLDRLVARMAAGIGASEVDDLATHGIRYVMLADARGAEDPLAISLDSQRGLRRVAAREGDTLWELVPTSARALTVAATTVNGVPVRVADAVPTQGGDPRSTTVVDSDVAAGPAVRNLVLAEAYDSRWRFTIDGQPATGSAPTDGEVVDLSLQQVPIGAPEVPVRIVFDGSTRAAWLWVQGIALALTVVLALPARRREDDDDIDDLADVEPVEVPEPVETLVPAEVGS
jgi:GT2 family glycosyltransferase